MLKVNIDTLKLTAPHSGTIEVTYGGKTQTVRCWNKDGRQQGRGWYIDIYGLACQFASGKKIWQAKITYWVESNKFTNLEPTNYQRWNGRVRCVLVGFESEFADHKDRSLHHGGYRH